MFTAELRSLNSIFETPETIYQKKLAVTRNEARAVGIYHFSLHFLEDFALRMLVVAHSLVIRDKWEAAC